MNKKRLKYILMGGVLILSLTGCDDYLNCEDTSGIITSDLIWQNPKAITAVLADMYDSGLRTDEFDDWYGAKHNLTNQTTLSDEATARAIRKKARLIRLMQLTRMGHISLMMIWRRVTNRSVS